MEKCNKKDLKKQKVWKSNALIGARYDLTLIELKFITISIAKLDPKLKNFEDYIVTVLEYADALGLEHLDTAYRDLKRISRSVLKKPFPIKEGDKEHQYNWFARITYVHNKGHVRLCHHPDITKLLLELKNKFTVYEIGYILQLPSVYAICCYEMLKQYEKIGNRTETIENLKWILGIDSNKYKLYGHFKKKVLDYIMHLLDKYTDIKFTYKEIKKGRKVVAIKFFISKNEKNIKKRQKKEAANTTAENQASETTEQEDQTEKTDYQRIYALIPVPDNKYKTLPKVINPHLKKQGYQYVKENVVYVVNQSTSKFMGYLKQALKENYAGYGKAKPNPKIAEAKKEAKECFKNPGNCSNGVWSSYAETAPCYWCKRHEKSRIEASNAIQTVKAKPAPEIKPEPQKVAAQAPLVEPQPQELSEVEQIKLQMQEIQKQMMEQMQEMQQAQIQEKQALQQEIQQLKAEKSAPAPEPIGATKVEDVKVGPDDFNDRQPPPSTLADNRLIAKWWIIREAVKEKIGAGPHDINLYPLILDYNRSDENKLTLLAPHGFSKNSIMKKGYLTMIQEAAGNIEIMLEVAPPKKSGFYNQPEHATA